MSSKLCVGLVLLLLLGCGSGADAPSAPVSNAVVVCLDTVRHDTFATPERTGVGDPLSPWLARALRFERAQAPSPWTVPSVASALTGLYPIRHGAGRFLEPVANLGKVVPRPMGEQTSTLAERLSASGVTTAAFVAHPWFASGYGLERGFETVQRRAGHAALLRRTEEWLDTASAPFLLYLHFMEAHERHRGPLAELEFSPRVAPWRGLEAVVPGAICDDPEGEDCRRYWSYLDAVLELREAVASLLAALEARGLLTDTVVLVYSDHGEEFGEHRSAEAARAGDPRGIYGAGHGHTLYQELLHVPLVVWHPRLEGRRVERRAGLIDVAPSIEAWLGLEASAADRSGQVLDGLLADSGRESRRLFASGIAYGPDQIALLAGTDKVVMEVGSGSARAFDLGLDPREQAPTAASERLTGALDQYRRRERPRDDQPAPEMSEDLLDELRSLGYLDGGAGGEDEQ